MSGILQAAMGTGQGLPPLANLVANTYLNSGSPPAVCNITFNAAGDFIVSDDIGSSGTWLTQGRASDCEIFWSLTSGTLTNGVAGAWLDMSAGQGFGVTDNVVGAPNKSCTGSVSIRRKSDSVVIAGPTAMTVSSNAT